MPFYSDKTKAVNLAGVTALDIIDEMQEIVDAWIDSNIRSDGFSEAKTITEYYDIDKMTQSEIVLKHFPVLSVTELVDSAQSDTPVILETGTFHLDSETGMIKLKNYVGKINFSQFFTKGLASVKVTYIYGYTTPPDIIVKIATFMLAKWAKMKKNQTTGDVGNLKSVKIGDYSESYDLEFLNIKSEFDDILLPMVKKAQEQFAAGV